MASDGRPADPGMGRDLSPDRHREASLVSSTGPLQGVPPDAEAAPSGPPWFRVPVYLGLICILSHGVLIPLLGFYWDDWPITWYSRVVGPGEIRYLESYRPLSGWWFALLRPVLGEAPIRWQLLNLANRWLLGWATWWTLKKLWPNRSDFALGAAAFVVVYPGYGQQFVSVNASRHLVGLGMFVGSLGLMLRARQGGALRYAFLVFSLLLMILSMLMTDYFYGLEVLRPIFLLVDSRQERAAVRQRLVRAMGVWSPYLAIAVLIGVWRFALLGSVFYEIQPLPGAGGPDGAGLSLATIAEDLFEAGVAGWGKAFELPDVGELGARSIWVYRTTVAAALAGSVSFILLRGRMSGTRLPTTRADWTRDFAVTLAVAVAALLAGEAGPWAAGLPVHLSFPSNRLTLPLMFGLAMILSSLLSAIRPRPAGMILIALTVGFSAGRNFWTAADFRWDWERQRSFIWQLVWRVPGLEPGTAVLSDDLPMAFETDNSVTAMINWIYPPGVVGDKLSFMVYDVESRLGGRLPELAEGRSIRHVYWTFANGRSLVFEGSTSQVLVIYHAPPACLRIVQPVYDGHMTGLPIYVARAFDLSRPELVRLDLTVPAQAPTEILGEEPDHGWCFYYEKADLARQAGDWGQAYALAKQALGLGQSPNHASEYVLFLEALGRQGEVSEAVRLTRLVVERAPGLDRMLCDAWGRIALVYPEEDRERLISPMQGLLPCLLAVGTVGP